MNRHQQHERRAEILRLAAGGADRQALAQQFSLSIGTIDAICRGTLPTPQQQQRQAIAEYVQAGHGTDEAAREFGMTIGGVQRACQIAGVPYSPAARRPGSGRPSILPVLADLINSAGNLSQIAQRHHVSRQAVAQVRDRARAAGIRMPQPTANAQNGRAKGKPGHGLGKASPEGPDAAQGNVAR